MRKFKIFTTILILYEFVILTVLQIKHYCVWFFNTGFCSASFKYFLMCVAIPTLFILIVWWWPDVSRKMCKNCQCIQPEPNAKEDIERLIIATVVAGIQKFISKHPKTIDVLNDFLNGFVKSDKNRK